MTSSALVVDEACCAVPWSARTAVRPSTQIPPPEIDAPCGTALGHQSVSHLPLHLGRFYEPHLTPTPHLDLRKGARLDDAHPARVAVSAAGRPARRRRAGRRR